MYIVELCWGLKETMYTTCHTLPDILNTIHNVHFDCQINYWCYFSRQQSSLLRKPTIYLSHSPIWHSSLLLISICSFLTWISLMRAFDIICINTCLVTLIPSHTIISLAGLYFITFHTVSILLLGFSSLNHWRILDIPWNYLLKVPDSQGTLPSSIEALPEKIKKKNTRVKVKIQKLQVHGSLRRAQFHGKSCPPWEEGILVPLPNRFFLFLDSSKLITVLSRFYLVKYSVSLSSFHPTAVV